MSDVDLEEIRAAHQTVARHIADSRARGADPATTLMWAQAGWDTADQLSGMHYKAALRQLGPLPMSGDDLDWWRLGYAARRQARRRPTTR